MNKFHAVLLAMLLVSSGGCWRRATPDPPTVSGELVFAAPGGNPATPVPGAAPSGKPRSDGADIDKIASNPWVIAGVFLLIQWIEIWYYNRTGRKSATIDAAEAAMQPKLGVIQRVLYRIWRWCYFCKNKDKNDPDKEEGKK